MLISDHYHCIGRVAHFTSNAAFDPKNHDVSLRTFSGHAAWLENLTAVLSATASAGGFTGEVFRKT